MGFNRDRGAMNRVDVVNQPANRPDRPDRPDRLRRAARSLPLPARRLLRMWPLLVAIALASSTLTPAYAAVASTADCPTLSEILPSTEWLRALSLDLRGTPPTDSEFDAVAQFTAPALAAIGDAEKSASVAKSLAAELEGRIALWLGSDAFTSQAVRRHRDLLWIGLSNLRLLGVPQSLAKSGALYWRNGGNVAFYHRGNRVPCIDEPAKWDDAGNLVFTKQPDGTVREGWVTVKPYWAPKTEIHVCALDAQDTIVSAAGQSCSVAGAYYDASCGCGPGLRWCRYGPTEATTLESFAQSLERQIAEVIAEDRPYTELFTDKTMWVNGPLVHFYSHQAQLCAPLRMTPTPVDPSTLPALTFDQVDTWVKISLGKEQAGILTAPAFLLRFQTNRARANRFYNTFLCQPFQAPDEGIPVDAASAVSEPDLQKRPGCKYCHALLEPVSAFWGRWVQNGAGFLDPVTFPPWRADCDACAKTGQQCSIECSLHYQTKALSEPEKAFYGWLGAYVFRAEAHKKHIDQGPKLMALTTVVDARLPKCVVRTTAQWLLGRELSGADELQWSDDLALSFVQGGYSYRTLVGAIVRSDRYRRVR
jgi:hypothetical protein